MFTPLSTTWLHFSAPPNITVFDQESSNIFVFWQVKNTFITSVATFPSGFQFYSSTFPPFMSTNRASGLLLHITSLPGRYGIGDLGPEAYRFADFLSESGQKMWQVLPVVPVGYGYSPYASPSTFAGNALFISPDHLLELGLLQGEDVQSVPSFSEVEVDFNRVIPFKVQLLQKAWNTFRKGSFLDMSVAFSAFQKRHAHWLNDYALFESIKQAHEEVQWTEWPVSLRDRDAVALEAFKAEHEDHILMVMFWQFLFDIQWNALKRYCNDRGIQIFGDLPIYVAEDSADVWARRDLFYLDASGNPTVVAGVPPDYFSETGQRWGNPLYRWDIMKQTGYAWWTSRMARILELVDLVRLDHFRGFEAYWEVPSSEKTAINGVWKKGPGADLFVALKSNLGALPVIAENLGVITDGVTRLMEEFGLPGMAILQFAFDTDGSNEFLPHNYVEPLVAYTGTHDNDTLMGWWTDTASTQNEEQIAKAKAHCRAYLNLDDAGENELTWPAISALMHSVCRYVVTPVQDVLGLDADARMNTPGTTDSNWGWRMLPDALNAATSLRLATLTSRSGR